MVPERPIEEYDVDLRQVQVVIADITTLLDERIDRCNKDPRFRHPTLSKKPEYLPIKKSSEWPVYERGKYTWRVTFEPGRDEHVGWQNLNFFPNPLKFLHFYAKDIWPEFEKKQKAIWLRANPCIDLSKGIYTLDREEILTTIISNNYQGILKLVDVELAKLAKSRLE
jgi:hypothetical protein